METNQLLQSLTKDTLTPEEESKLISELTAAYHQDESSATSTDVERIAEKVKAKLKQKPQEPH